MSKTIPSALQTHYNLRARTTCGLLKITPNVGFEGTPLPDIGMGTTNGPLTYNDGDGAVVYSAIGGFVPSSMVATADFSVDNGEVDILIPAYDLGPIVEAHVNAGRYDFSEFTYYRVNYKDLTTGRHEVVAHGSIGQMRVVNGLVVATELRSLMQQYRQSVCEVDSITCRNEFGDARCGVDVDALWVSGSVTSVGSEADCIFSDSSRAEADDYFAPGMVRWTSGNNTGRSYEVELFASDTFTLTFPTAFDIEVGDDYEVRKHCRKRYLEDCIGEWENGLNFNGEPYIPVGDEAALATPGAATPSPNRRRPVDDVYEPDPLPDEIPPVSNGDFETGDLTGWTALAGAAGWSVVSASPGQGTYSLKYDPVAGGVGTGIIAADAVDCPFGSRVSTSALIKLGWSTTDTAYAGAVGSKTTNSTLSGAVSRSASWVRVGSSTYQRQDGSATEIQAVLTAYTDGTNPVYFDDVRLEIG